MARLLLLTDRRPDDPEWKGAFAWNIILSLAESQHEVLALTTLSPEEVNVSHPRLTVARPARSFGLQHMGKWLRALFQFQPDVIHTFALQPSGIPRALTVWPMLESMFRVMPRVRHFSTLLGTDDYAPFSQIETPLEIATQNSEFGILNSEYRIPNTEFSTDTSIPNCVLIPAPVSEWNRVHESLLLLNEFLLSNRDLHVFVVGGWGDLSLSERREGWRILESVNQQVHMGDALKFPEFVQLARSCRGLWLRPLALGSWRAMAAAQVARGLNLPTWGEVPELNVGSTANFLSRLYSS